MEEALETAAVESAAETVAIESEKSIADLAQEYGTTEDVISKAMEQKWRPDFEGKNRKSPQVWVEVGDLREKNEKLFHRLSQQEKGAKEMARTLKQLHQAYQNGEIAKINANKMAAVEAGDVAAVKEYDKNIEEFKKQSEQAFIEQERDAEVEAAAASFIERNADWYNTDNVENEILSEAARKYEQHLLKKYPEVPVNDRLDLVEKYIKDKYINNTKEVSKTPKVGTANKDSVGVAGTKAVGLNNLPEDVRREVDSAAKLYEQVGCGTYKEYLQLDSIKDLLKSYK